MGSQPKVPWRFLPPPPPDEGSPGFGNIEDFRQWAVNPPSLCYLTVDDRIWLRTLNRVVVTNFILRARILMLDGQVHYTELTTVAQGTGGYTVFNLAGVEGFLLDMVVESIATSNLRGNTFVQAGLGKFDGPILRAYATLISGYCFGSHKLEWPFSTYQAATDGAGEIRSINVANPGAGVEFTFTATANRRTRLRSVFFTLVTSAVAATRGVRLIIDDGAAVLLRIPANLTQAASLTQVYNGSAAPFATTAIVGEAFIPLPTDYMLASGFRVRSLTNNIDVGDQYSTIQFNVEEWWDAI